MTIALSLVLSCIAVTPLILASPPPGYLPFQEFKEKFSLGEVSTEQSNHITKELSLVMQEDTIQGLDLLIQVDESVIEGTKLFTPMLNKVAPQITKKIEEGGRVFLIGSGTSGRISLDLAAKCGKAFPAMKDKIQGIIAGGDSVIVRAKEFFEDSEQDGEKAIQKKNLTDKDVVILLSASGSASFNVGAGHYAAEKGALVLYFYNSGSIPSRTKKLFDREKNPVIPLCLDIGPPAISGSTRLQSATLAQSCIGSLLSKALNPAQDFHTPLLVNMEAGIAQIRGQMDKIALFIKTEQEVFSDPMSNFRKLKDVSDCGYVTFLALEDSLREVLVDTTETSPTFSTNFIRKESEAEKKRAEFRSYLAGENDNKKAWQTLLGREISAEDLADTDAFIISSSVSGLNSYANRPKGAGNFLIGVVKLQNEEKISPAILDQLKICKDQNGKVGIILLHQGEIEEQKLKRLQDLCDGIVITIKSPHDDLGLIRTILLKQTLNLISNGSMIYMNKVYGNQMIDVRASNQKLIDRCIRLIQEVLRTKNISSPSYEELYYLVTHINNKKRSYTENGIYTPSIVKTAITMILHNKTIDNFEEVIDILRNTGEVL